jgi:hypothetical protein
LAWLVLWLKIIGSKTPCIWGTHSFGTLPQLNIMHLWRGPNTSGISCLFKLGAP